MIIRRLRLTLCFSTQKLIFFNIVPHNCDISTIMIIWKALWILVAWRFSTRASVAAVLSMHPCVSNYLASPGHQQLALELIKRVLMGFSTVLIWRARTKEKFRKTFLLHMFNTTLLIAWWRKRLRRSWTAIVYGNFLCQHQRGHFLSFLLCVQAMFGDVCPYNLVR